MPEIDIQITQGDIFPIPLFQVPVPEMTKFHTEIINLFTEKLKNGELGPHTNGYGYQTPTNLFDTNVYDQTYFREVLMAAFHHACRRILNGAITDFDAKIRHQWINTFNVGWAVVQTNETWPEENPWHTHLPAVLSGCYYVQTTDHPEEGWLQFSNPISPNIFQPKTGEIKPEVGTLLIFPSFLSHRPAPTPSTGNKVRLSLCMDGHWTSKVGRESPIEKQKTRRNTTGQG